MVLVDVWRTVFKRNHQRGPGGRRKGGSRRDFVGAAKGEERGGRGGLYGGDLARRQGEGKGAREVSTRRSARGEGDRHFPQVRARCVYARVCARVFCIRIDRTSRLTDEETLAFRESEEGNAAFLSIETPWTP